MTKSETPIKDKLPSCYESGAQQAMTEPLQKSDSWSTGDMNLKNQQREAHEQALASEQRHYGQIHPYTKPKPKW